MKVYFVIEGRRVPWLNLGTKHSDHRILGVFTNEAAARATAASINPDFDQSVRVEEVEADGSQPIDIGCPCFDAAMDGAK